MIARYIVEECDTTGNVHNMLTAGGPHMGTDSFPHCFNGLFCDLANWLVNGVVYTSFA